MPCPFPEHHAGSSGGGAPAGLLAIVIGAVIIGTSGAFASIVHSIMLAVLATDAAVTVVGLGGLALVLHHRRAVARAAAPVTLHLEARPRGRDTTALAARPRTAAREPSRTVHEVTSLGARPARPVAMSYVPRRRELGRGGGR